MNERTKKLTSLLLLLSLLLTLVPKLAVDTRAAAVTASGTCGENLTWTLDDEGTLTISGTGAMENFIYYETAPWDSYRLQVKRVVVESGVTTIGDYAFRHCTNLISIDIPDSVEIIGSFALENCTGLMEIRVDANNANFYDNNGVLFNKDKTVLICYPAGKTGSYKIPASVETIDSYAFHNCTGLTDLEIPDSVKTIDGFVFENCTGLTNIEIPASVETIGQEVFHGCTGLLNITVDSSNADFCDKNGVLFNKDKTVLICYPAGRNGAYTIPESVKSIYVFAFEDCTGLTNVIIPDSVEIIYAFAFSGCTNLTSVDIGNSVSIIDTYAFEGCTSLEIVEIPDSVEFIYDFAFAGCTSLKRLDIGNSVKSIKQWAFSDCTSLTSVEIPNSVETIEYEAFYRCTSLTVVSIGNSVESIYYDAFARCQNLNEIYFEGRAPEIEDCAFDYVTATAYYYPDETWTEDVMQNYGGNITWVARERKVKPGDIDTNGQVNRDDVIALLLHVSMPDAFPISIPADFNGDGAVTRDDVIQLLLHVSMPDAFPLQ